VGQVVVVLAVVVVQVVEFLQQVMAVVEAQVALEQLQD
jgi:hypothetical protein